MVVRVRQPNLDEPPIAFPANRLLKLRELIATDLAAHIAAADPHPVYLTQAEADALYDPLGGGTGLTHPQVMARVAFVGL